MFTTSEADLKAIAPYTDAEFKTAIQRVVAHPGIASIGEFFPGIPLEKLQEKALALTTILEFQTVFIDPLLKGLEKRTTSGITLSGAESLAKDRSYLFLCNHRDILLDSALFTDLLFRNGFPTPQICLGDNLLVDPLVVDLVKMNKGITVKRNLPPRELLRWSYTLSEWLKRTITSGMDSVWIAQDEGRCKDGNDVTHPGVIKMLALASEGSVTERLRALNIIPVAVSYEYDPSDVEKAYEIHLTEKHGSYQKKAGEDLRTMVRGLRAPKGGIYIQVGTGIDDILKSAEALPNRSEQVKQIASGIDERIQAQYHNWPSNYIAHDLLNRSSVYSNLYTAEKQSEFARRLESRLTMKEIPQTDREDVKHRVLKMYAASVRS